MRLLQAAREVGDSSFTNESGQVLYRASTPWGLNTTTTISCVLPKFDSREPDDQEMQDRFGTLAQILWKFLRPTKLRFRGEEVTLSGGLFTKEGWGYHGRYTTVNCSLSIQRNAHDGLHIGPCTETECLRLRMDGA